MSALPPRLEPKLLYRRLDALLGTLDTRRASKEVMKQFVEEAFHTFREDLRLRAVLLYREGRDSFGIVKTVGHLPAPATDSLDPESPPLSQVLTHGVFLFDNLAMGGSADRLGPLPSAAAAALVVGRRPRRDVVFFLLDFGWVREELDFALNTIRSALGARIGDERVRGSFKEAAKIQASLLLEPPDYPGYEIACRTEPADEVGGDFYDFLPLGPELLGIAIGDASGHGLPAALLVRDVVTGLRMGLEQELKITHVLSKLNRVIHRSALSSRFVSVFYGELEPGGNLIYANAGHQPPVLFSRGRTLELDIGGTVIGPLPEVRFRRGFQRLEAGDVLVMVTDGIIERRDPLGEFFGTEGVERTVRAAGDASAKEITTALYEASLGHGASRPWEDDATIVVVKRQG